MSPQPTVVAVTKDHHSPSTSESIPGSTIHAAIPPAITSPPLSASTHPNPLVSRIPRTCRLDRHSTAQPCMSLVNRAIRVSRAARNTSAGIRDQVSDLSTDEPAAIRQRRPSSRSCARRSRRLHVIDVEHAEANGLVIVPVDIGFPMLIALRRATSPSIVLLRTSTKSHLTSTDRWSSRTYPLSPIPCGVAPPCPSGPTTSESDAGRSPDDTPTCRRRTAEVQTARVPGIAVGAPQAAPTR